MISATERIIGTIAATMPLAASVVIDRHFGYAIGCGLWGMIILSWVWNDNLKGKSKAES